MMRSLRSWWLVVGLSVRVSPWQTVISGCQAIGQALHAFNPVFVALLVNGVLNRDQRSMLLAVLAFAGSTGINLGLQVLGSNARISQLERVNFALDREVTELTATIATLDHLETPRYLDELQALRDNSNALGAVLNGLVIVVNNLVYGVVTVVVAASADWRLLPLILLGIPRIFATRWTVAWDRDAEAAAATPSRLSTHLIGLTTGVTAGAETRVFGLQNHLLAQVDATVAAWREPSVRSARKHGTLESVNSLVYFGAAAAIIAWMTHDAVAGTVSATAVMIAIGTVGNLQGISELFVYGGQLISDSMRTATRFVWLREYAAKVSAEHAGREMPPPHLSTGIRLENVSYRYGDSDTDSLTNITLDLPAGSVVALVGENGAGKSTLVKLLTGMYRPTHGRILIDGTDLTNLDITAWRTRTSGAFQDYVKFEFTAQQSVGIGDLPQVDDPDEVRRALRDGAADDVLTALPNGLGTQLGPTWTNGVDLSGGQWQRLAIARAMMRTDPLLLVLDEPTSALDAHTENTLFQRYATAVNHAQRRGAITLLVTHRFSTVSAADLVVVLDNGHIIETGTHTELTTTGGHYADLYELQARGYR